MAVGDIRTKIRDILGAFLFGGEAIDKPVRVLSGGERSRLAMIRLLLQPVNLLILDEPTNHLDIPSKQVLKDAIQAFDGTVILVSHDRDFLDGLVQKVYEFGHQRVKEHLGGIYEYLQKINLESLQELEKRQSPVAASASTAPSAPQSSASFVDAPSTKSSVDPRAAAASLPPLSGGSRSLSFEQQKALKAQTAKLERQIKAIEDKLEDLQAQIDELEARMSTPEGSQDQQLYIRHAALKSEMDDVSFEWLEASEKLEKLQD